MSTLQNTRHEAFAQAVASGMSPPDAFRKISGKRRAGDREMAKRWMRKVDIRLRELQLAGATATTMNMKERREFCARVVRAHFHAIDLTKDGDLVQEITRIEGSKDEAGIEKLKLPGKLECVLADAKLAGELIDRTDQTSGGQPIVPLIQINIAPHWGKPRTGLENGHGAS